MTKLTIYCWYDDFTNTLIQLIEAGTKRPLYAYDAFHETMVCLSISLRWRHMNVMLSQIIGHSTVYLTGYADPNQIKSSSLALCEGNSPVTGEFPIQRASNVEKASIWWRHHERDFLGWKKYVVWFKFEWKFSLKVQFTISQHWFWHWFGAEYALYKNPPPPPPPPRSKIEMR